jgi:hypothetical protein
MIVGEGEADRYLDPVVDRVMRWADKLHIALAPNARAEGTEIMAAGIVDHVSYLRISADENEAMAKNEAWLETVHAFKPTEDDLIAFVKPTEAILDADAVRAAAKEYPGLALRVRLVHMWDEDHIRIDGSWEPKDETVFVPFKSGASYPDYRLRCGRLPSYHYQSPYHGVPVSYMLDYDMMTFRDKVRKNEWFEKVGGADFWPIDHIQSIQRTPTLRIWKKGGLLNAREVDGPRDTGSVGAVR